MQYWCLNLASDVRSVAAKPKCVSLAVLAKAAASTQRVSEYCSLLHEYSKVSVSGFYFHFFQLYFSRHFQFLWNGNEYFWCITLWLKEGPPPRIHMTSFYKCWLISVIFGTQCTKLICHVTVIDLPTSPSYCCYTTLGNINCCIGQDSSLAHRACQTIELLQREISKFIPPDF